MSTLLAFGSDVELQEHGDETGGEIGVRPMLAACMYRVPDQDDQKVACKLQERYVAGSCH